MFDLGEVITHPEMCRAEGLNLQQGMHFRRPPRTSVVLMSVRRGAPYADRVEDDGRVLVYEGHDVPRSREVLDPKSMDQPAVTPKGTKTQNGLFLEAVKRFKRGEAPAVEVRVYEKVRSNIWVYNGVFRLTDAWQGLSDHRRVFKFRLELDEEGPDGPDAQVGDLPHRRLVPSEVKLAVWKRDRGRCVVCGSTENLHFDHIIPFSRGGSSLVAENIQLLCARHNLEKRDRIE